MLQAAASQGARLQDDADAKARLFKAETLQPRRCKPDPPARHRIQPRGPERRRLAERRMRPRRLRRRTSSSSTSSPDAPCWAKCPRSTPSSPSASSTKAAACSSSFTRPSAARINKAWGLALRKRFCRSFNFELQAAATDNGLNIALAEQHSFPLGDVFHFLQTRNGAGDARAGRAGLADLRDALALGRQPLAGAAALPGRQEGSAADSAHSQRRSARVGLSRRRRLPGEHRRRHPDSRSSAGRRGDEGRPHRGDGHRRPARRADAAFTTAAFAAWRSTRRCRRSSRTRS